MNPHQLTTATSRVQDLYSALEQEIFKMFIDRLNDKGLINDSVQKWQIKKLGELNLVNDAMVKMVAEVTGTAKKELEAVFLKDGVQIYRDTLKAVRRAKKSVRETNTIDQLMTGYLKQTFLDLDNNVNQTLISTNYGENTVVTGVYQQIVKETTASVINGFKTPDRALADTIYKWRGKGIGPVFVDKGNHQWSLESYARMVIQTTSARAFQAARDQVASDNGIDTFAMSEHSAARPACAPIQGGLVTTRLSDYVDPESGEHFISLYAHGYGDPGGTFGINCTHMKWPYIPGVNKQPVRQYKPAQSVDRYNFQQKQRGLERRVRNCKRNAELAGKLGDQQGIDKYTARVHKYQAALRKLVSDHDFLIRDYSREKIF